MNFLKYGVFPMVGGITTIMTGFYWMSDIATTTGESIETNQTNQKFFIKNKYTWKMQPVTEEAYNKFKTSNSNNITSIRFSSSNTTAKF